jgi:hypothetical protein
MSKRETSANLVIATSFRRPKQNGLSLPGTGETGIVSLEYRNLFQGPENVCVVVNSQSEKNA